MSARKGAATKMIIGVLLVVIVCMGAYIVHLSGADDEPPATADAPVVDEIVAPVVEPAVEPEPDSVPEPDADSTPATEVKTGFTLESDIVYMIEDAPMWSDYSTSGEKIGTMACGESEARLGQGYGEAEGWSRFMLTPNGFVYIENKYLSTEKPKTDNTLEGLDGWLPPPNNEPENQSNPNPSTPVENEQNQDQNVSKPSSDSGSGNNSGNNSSGAGGNPPVNNNQNTNIGNTDSGNTPNTNTGGGDVLISFDELKEMSSGEGNQSGDIIDSDDIDQNTSGSNTDHDYSGIIISP